MESSVVTRRGIQKKLLSGSEVSMLQDEEFWVVQLQATSTWHLGIFS